MTSPTSPYSPVGAVPPPPSGAPGPVPPPTGGYYTPALQPRSAPGFHGVPARDYVTDVVAALLLLLSLGLTWDASTQATAHIGVVLITILSVLSLSVHYLYRVGVFPAGWSAGTVTLVRALVNVPYLVLVGIAVILDVVSVLSQSSSITPVVGTALIVGLAGATLAAMPRAAETDAALAAAMTARLRPTFLGLAIAAALFQLLGLIAPAVNGSYGVLGGSWSTFVVIAALGFGVLAVWALVGVSRADDAWRPVVVVIGATLVLWTLVAGRESGLSTSGATLGLIVLPAAAPLATAPAAWRIGADRRGYGLAAAGDAFRYLVLLAVFGVASAIAVLTVGGYVGTGTLITILILDLVAGVAAVVGRASLTGPARTPTFVVLGLIVVLGIVVLAVQGSSGGQLVSTWNNGLFAFGLPGVVLWALALPAANRTLADAFRPTTAVSSPVRPVATGYGYATPPVPYSPAQAPVPAPAPAPAPAATPAPAQTAPVPVPAPAHGFTAQQAVDPGTDPALLTRIAAEAPELRPALAVNPATYPTLLQWLADLHDPAVDAALAQRAG